MSTKIKRTAGLVIAVGAVAAFPAAANAASADSAAAVAARPLTVVAPNPSGGGCPDCRPKSAGLFSGGVPGSRPRVIRPNPSGGICPDCRQSN